MTGSPKNLCRDGAAGMATGMPANGRRSVNIEGITQPMVSGGQAEDNGLVDERVVASVATDGPAVALARATASPTRAPGLVLAVLLVAVFMAVLDATIVNVAAPAIRRTLRASGPASSS